jgi:hypothetical protein
MPCATCSACQHCSKPAPDAVISAPSAPVAEKKRGRPQTKPKDKPKREATTYNLFVKEKSATEEIKQITNHHDRFKRIAVLWNEQKSAQAPAKSS